MKKFGINLAYFLSVYAVSILFCTLFRIFLFIDQVNNIADLSGSVSLILRAFFMGLRFDTVVVCYILILPLLVVVLSAAFRFFRKWLYLSIHLWFCFFLSVVLMLCAANIPYFDQFFKNINASVWNWFGEPAFVVGMITEDRNFFFFSLLYVVLVVLFCFVLYRLYRYFLNQLVIANSEEKGRFDGKVLLAGVVCLAGCFIGIRGRVAIKSPIRIGTAYFCNDPFLNQMGLNPAFVFLRTTLDSRKNKRNEIHLMENEQALENARRYLGVTDTLYSVSPIARVIPGKEHSDQNVILIMVESLRSNLLGQGEKSLVPYLDTLVARSTYFSRFYSAGIHTMNGVYGCLFGFPALLNQHPFKAGDILTYESLPVVLKKRGYSTLYFTTHDEQFDNIGGYLSANHVEKITSQKDYPVKEVHSNLGVCDDYMFKTAIPILNQSVKSGKPFFATFLTASNHQPYIIPDYFKPRATETVDQIIEYTDWSLQQFFNWASKQSWYNNTLFVITGDHGSSVGDRLYDVSLAYHQVPLIFFTPSNKTSQVVDRLGGQIDIFPTIMGQLGLGYTNLTLGVDLFKEKRPYMFFSSDNSLECVDDEFFYVKRLSGEESLYRYVDKDPKDYKADYPDRVDQMRVYAESMMQSAQYIVKNNKVKVN